MKGFAYIELALGIIALCISFYTFNPLHFIISTLLLTIAQQMFRYNRLFEKYKLLRRNESNVQAIATWWKLKTGEDIIDPTAMVDLKKV